MGNWTIHLKGHGIHDNGRPDDADNVMRRFVRELEQLGHQVFESNFTAGDVVAAPAEAAAAAPATAAAVSVLNPDDELAVLQQAYPDLDLWFDEHGWFARAAGSHNILGADSADELGKAIADSQQAVDPPAQVAGQPAPQPE